MTTMGNDYKNSIAPYLRANEAAAELNITVTSLYKLKNSEDPNRRLEPFNLTTYKGDGGFVYKREDIDRVKPLYVKSDLTVSQAAKRIGRSTTYLHKLLRNGDLPYYEDTYRGKKTFFIKTTDLDHFISKSPEG